MLDYHVLLVFPADIFYTQTGPIFLQLPLHVTHPLRKARDIVGLAESIVVSSCHEREFDPPSGHRWNHPPIY